MADREQCREYVRNAALWFGTSVVPPGQRGSAGPGHDISEEVFYCAERRVHGLLIPRGPSQAIISVGETPATVVWTGASGE